MNGKEQVQHQYLNELMKILNKQTDDKADIENLLAATIKFKELLEYEIDQMPGVAPDFFGTTDGHIGPKEKIIPERDTFNPPGSYTPFKISAKHEKAETLKKSWEDLKHHLDKIIEANKNNIGDIVITLFIGDLEIVLWEDFLPKDCLELDNYLELGIHKLNQIQKEYHGL